MNLLIVGKDGKYYYGDEGNLHELNEETMNDLRSIITDQLSIKFRGCDINFVSNIIGLMYDEPMDLSVKNVSDTNLDYDAEVTKPKAMTM